ncbi:MAG: 50S ribosomal protein L22 [Candidatus Cloacimonetes bacterium]|nr:50S ribosomal protein L22 [Candidatus Cloacimonadota bacterium]MBL7085608.1 50S ribosomal protein L22 [Candidatus Cloacimonadota bacterium]
MEAVAKVKNQRGSAHKVRLIADLIRKKSVNEAKDILTFSNKLAAKILAKILDAAIANAVNKAGKIETDKLIINSVLIDEGITMKRYRSRARGRADMIRKRTCNITLTVSDEHNTQNKKEENIGSKN